jgi:glutamate-1-semialdehyde 2,1-aminomutase
MSRDLGKPIEFLNDGFLITPFHNMALMCSDTTEADVDGHTAAFRAMCAELTLNS